MDGMYCEWVMPMTWRFGYIWKLCGSVGVGGHMSHIYIYMSLSNMYLYRMVLPSECEYVKVYVESECRK